MQITGPVCGSVHGKIHHFFICKSIEPSCLSKGTQTGGRCYALFGYLLINVWKVHKDATIDRCLGQDGWVRLSLCQAPAAPSMLATTPQGTDLCSVREHFDHFFESEEKQRTDPVSRPVFNGSNHRCWKEPGRRCVRGYLHKNATHTTAERFVAVAARQQWAQQNGLHNATPVGVWFFATKPPFVTAAYELQR